MAKPSWGTCQRGYLSEQGEWIHQAKGKRWQNRGKKTSSANGNAAVLGK
jgi:hypothetical protein